MLSLDLSQQYDANDPEAPEVITECADCLSRLTEDDPEPTTESGDRKCLSCEAETEAADIVLAEVRPDWTPTRTIEERKRAVSVIEAVIRRAKARIAAEEAQVRGLSELRSTRAQGRCNWGAQ